MSINPSDEISFDARQISVFKVDDDVRVSECNITAFDLLVSSASGGQNERLGDALLCINSLDTPEGCGSTAACLDCSIRNAIAECFQNGSVVRRRVEVTLKYKGLNTWRKFMITVNPLYESSRMYAILILEDLCLSLLHEKLPVHINRDKPNYDDKYHGIIEDHLIKYSNIIF